MAIYRPPPPQDGGEVQKSRAAAEPEEEEEGGGGETDDRRTSFTRLESMHVMMNNNEGVKRLRRNKWMKRLNYIRELCGDIVNHDRVTHLVINLIVINAIMMGVATFDFVTENQAVEKAFDTTDKVFLIIFTIELCMQFIFRGLTLFLDGWLVFDFVIVVLSWSLESLQIFRVFRIFRALRIITRIETMKNLVAALFDIMPRLAAITALLLLIFYIFAVLFTNLFGELPLEGDPFQRLDYSVLTLFVMMTMEWAGVARACMVYHWWAWIPFVAFIMITGFIVFNLIIAVVCDAVAVIENKDDLEPDMFSGIGIDSRDGPEIREEDVMIQGVDGELYSEDEIVDQLAEQMASVLMHQKEMLATLEALAKDSLVPVPPAARR